MDEFKFAIINTETGLVEATLASADTNYTDGAIIFGQLYRNLASFNLSEVEAINHYYDFETKTLNPLPTKPSEYHKWNAVAKAWGVSPSDVEAAKIKKKNGVEFKRRSLESSFILYDTKNLDADAEAIKNINGKLQELAAKQALNIPVDTASLFWRDADNIIHTWADVETYKAWLQGFAIAIAERTSNLYQIAWQKKAEIDALNDIDEIFAYDVECGW